jgi:hypothetical protein
MASETVDFQQGRCGLVTLGSSLKFHRQGWPHVVEA